MVGQHLCSIVGGVRVCVGVCVCRFKTPPCADSKHLRVCRQNARVTMVTLSLADAEEE